MHEVRGQLARIVFVVFPSTVWVPRIKLGSSGLAASTCFSPLTNFNKLLEIDNLIKGNCYVLNSFCVPRVFLKLSTYNFYISNLSKFSPLHIVLLTHLRIGYNQHCWSAPEDRMAPSRHNWKARGCPDSGQKTNASRAGTSSVTVFSPSFYHTMLSFQFPSLSSQIFAILNFWVLPRQEYSQ